ncbi:cytochrome c oxidase subunit II [Duganella violaceipulchra]|uniref:Cytochrome c oxidase subunit 2 n=1 Tax=Duganella violaceipulchra TaxID=2849652 RepID=A0AA41L5L8_9BURK|nr:cytochrome c oxidase subunit II [Duganella violaceicalia]MBV6322377.1 cytochrome c oxidase subunit II [Duganella violaceicalia]MCP2011524.1 cytochrome c oxidase subunit 2 [Duganella violaceicalia]
MALALVLVLIVVGALEFHYMSPWWLTPIASNWQQMDDALMLTFAITGVAFVVINLFVAYAVVTFRHRDGVRAAATHGSARLEWWLVGVTTVGIVALLAPGLSVYAKLIDPPPDAMVFEVLGQQWQWHYRLPGKDGKLGSTDMRFIGNANPYGINPADPGGQDDVLVDGQEVHILIGRPVRVLLRAQDVLHDFYVPEFRTRMNMVPGMVTSFWFTPSRLGRFEVMCAQLCGIGHFNMRSYVVVDDEPAYRAWLAAQPTFAALTSAAGAEPGQQGRLLAQARGCAACHSVDGNPGVGPSWKGLFGKNEAMNDGATVRVDEAYLRESITNPAARVVKGYQPIMPVQPFQPAEVAQLVEYIKTIK